MATLGEQKRRESQRALDELLQRQDYSATSTDLRAGKKISAEDIEYQLRSRLGLKDGQDFKLSREFRNQVNSLDEITPRSVSRGSRAVASDLTQIPALVPQVQVEPQGVPSGREVAQSEIIGRKPGIKGVVNALIPEDVKRATNKFSEEFTFALSPILDTILRANQKDTVGSQGATGQTVGVGNQVVEQLQRLMSDTKKSANKQLNKATGAQTAEEEILQALKEDPTFKDIFAPVNKSKSAPRTIQDIAKMGGTGVRRTKAGRAYQITADGKLILQ